MVKDRLKIFLASISEKQTDFCRKLNVSQGYIAGMRKSIQPDKLKSISNEYPALNIDWLLTGKGEMLKSTSVNKDGVPVNLKSIEIPLVSKYAYAGYLSGYGDDEYMEKLETINFDIKTEEPTPKGTYVGIEVKGDSMFDGSIQSIEDGDKLVCKLVDPILYKDSRLNFRNWNFVIVHKTEGIIVKRITDHDVEHGSITIHSLNSDYPDRTIFLKDVAQIWNVVQLIRKPIIF